jgi:hypothetical protein
MKWLYSFKPAPIQSFPPSSLPGPVAFLKENLEIYFRVISLHQFFLHLLSRKAEGNGPMKP